jgi:ATP-dependent DNA helicase PIF1
MLDQLQTFAIEKFKEGLNLFITGKAGCGKSFLVKKMMELDTNKTIAVTSTTGISSLNINGRTFHSWCSITPDTDLEKIDEFVNEINSNHKKLNKWLFTDILIIDEISMMDGKLLDFVNKVAKIIRGNNKSFGGIQLIVTGDFYQLPPVNKDKDKSLFCFESNCWSNLIDQVIILKKSYRQDEKELIKFLGYIREGNINEFVEKKLEFYSKNPNYDMKHYTHLFPHRSDVNKHNIAKLNELSGTLFKNKATVISLLNKKEVEYFPKDTTISQHLQLKKGALVIINKNINQDIGLVNGRQCIIEEIIGKENNIDSITISLLNGNRHTLNKCIWKFNDYEIEQFPITLAWALTIHKAQGMGIEKLSVDIGLNIFNKGQVYVALSRCINSKYLHIKNYNISAIKAHKLVKNFYLKASKTFWYEFEDNSGKKFFQNRDTDETSWKLPPKGEIVLDESSDEDEVKESSLLEQNLCKTCKKNEYFSNYLCDYKEKVCLQCISNSKDGYYKQYNKTELKTEWQISDKFLENILPTCNFSYERSSFGYRSVKIYLLGQVRKNMIFLIIFLIL